MKVFYYETHCFALKEIVPGIVKLLLLLLNLSINFLPDLAKLKLSPQNLVFFLFQSSLCLFKGSLKLFFLNLKPATLLVKLVD